MTKLHCTLQVLSPVHVGNGVKLKDGVDFYTDNARTFVVPEYALSEHLRHHPNDVQAFMSDKKKQRSEVLKKVVGKKRYDVHCQSSDLLQHERDGMGKPYIPGSSVKGALRTILLKKCLKDLSQQTRRTILDNAREMAEWASDPMLKEIFGADPNHNLLRVLTITDAYFSEDDIDVERIGILNLNNQQGTSYGWKNVPGRNTVERIDDATSIYGETLAQGTEARCTLGLDMFLLNNAQAKTELRFPALTADDLFRTVNAYSYERIQADLAFYKKFNSKELQPVIEDLEDIAERIPIAGHKDETRCIVFRLAWGTGWQNMTGDWLTAQELQTMRQRFGLGKNGYPVFPKTRKIVFEDITPKTVTGWVEIVRD